MAKVTWADTVQTTQLQDAFPSFNTGFIPQQNKFQKGVTDALRNGLSIVDNMAAVLVPLTGVVHGTEFAFPVPKGFAGRPLFFQSIEALLPNGLPSLPIASCSALNRNRKDGMLGITVQFAPPLGLITRRRTLSDFSVPNSLNTDFTWDTTAAQLGGITAASTSVFTCAYAGRVHVDYCLLWNTGGGAGIRQAWVLASNGAQRLAEDITCPTAAVPNYASSGHSDTIDVAAGTTFKLLVSQSSGAPLTVLAGNACAITAQYAAPPVGYIANVTGILWAA